ncbi:hypothetical protein HaLaN_33155, partial [Haematococcus lacustris]
MPCRSASYPLMRWPGTPPVTCSRPL